MNETEKKTDTQVITVDAGRLSRGLKTAFEGVAMIFGSLGVDIAPEMTEAGEKPRSSGIATDADDAAKDEESTTSENIPDVQKETTQEKQRDKEQTDPGGETQKTGSRETTASSLTLDDVTKVIVQKIRKDRSNNEKIGQILKTFSVGKVSDLPADKYEAFLTELAAL